VVGAFDRHNYGDLLFPLIVERAVAELGIAADLDYYATSVSAMSIYGGKDTKNIRHLFSREPSLDEKVVLAGGEVLPAKWSLIFSYLTGRFAAKVINRLSDVVGDQVSSVVIGRLLGSRSVLPFVYSPVDFDRKVSVLYNAVGGSHIKDESRYIRANLLAKLRDASHISVRDEETFDFLKSNGIDKVRLSPDCAILLSQFYPVEYLDSLITTKARELKARLPSGYICVQSAAAYTVGNEKLFLRSIDNIKKVTGLGVVVFAIGRATGHSDQQTFDIFRGAHSSENVPPTVISECESVYDLMWLIANSQAYVGTSLHGAITSASYGVPVLGLCPSRVNKLQAFLKTWVDAKSFQLAEFNEIDAAFGRLWASRGLGQSEKIAHAQAVAMQNFRAMFLPGSAAPL
jgi:hypothetical protein